MGRNSDERAWAGSTTSEPLEDRRLLSLSPLGAEFTVATNSAPDSVTSYGPGTPAYYNGKPVVGTNARGDAVVAWAADGADGVDVYARRYAAGGVPVGDAFVVNESLPGDQALPAVAVAGDGTFVVSWTSRGTGPTPGVYARRFDGGGLALGGEFLVAANPPDTTVNTTPQSTRVALAPGGQFVVAWETANVYLRRYAADGAPQGLAAQVSATTSTSGNANLYGAFADSSGNYTLVFDNGTYALSARRYGADGAPVTGIVDLRNGDTSYVAAGGPAMDAAGNLVIPWSSFSKYVYARRFNPDLTPAGNAFFVSLSAGAPTATIDSAGAVTVAYWYSTVQGQQVRLGTFPAGGGPGATFRVIGGNDRASTALAVAGDGSVFELSQDADPTGALYGRWYQGFTSPASLGDRVWRDANADGVQGPADYGVYQATVTLYNTAGVEIQTTTTDASGHYAFPEVLPGQAVYVQVTPRGDYFPTAPGQGADPALDSDLDPATWRTGPLTLAPGEARTDVDLGLVPYAKVSGTVFHDADEDGVQDAGEPSLGGWVAYADVDGDGQLDPGEPSAVTGANGAYTLDAVRPGAVGVRLVPQPMWNDPGARAMALAPGQAVQSVNWANTTAVLGGAPRASGPLVTPVPAATSGDPQIAMDGQGRSVVAWVAGGKVYVQRFDATLASLGAAAVVATDAHARFLRVTAAESGEFIVSWQSTSSGLPWTYARRYDAAAQPLTAVYKVGTERMPTALAMFKGGGVVAARAATDGQIYLERYSAAGVLVGSPVPIAGPDAVANEPSVAVDANGAFVVAWIQLDAPGGTDHDVFARAFGPDGSPTTDPFRVNSSRSAGDQYAPIVAGAGDGRFVVGSYDASYNGGNPGAYVRRVGLAGPVGGEIGAPVPSNSSSYFGVALARSGEFVLTMLQPDGYVSFSLFSAAGVPATRAVLPYLSHPIGPAVAAFDAGGDFVLAANEYNNPNTTGALGLRLQRYVVPPAVAPLARPAAAGPADLRVRFSSDVVGVPPAGQVSVRELTTGRVLDPSEYTWDYDPTTRVVSFKLLGVGTSAVDGNYRLTVPAAAVTDAAGNAMTSDFTLDFFVLAGDANRDRVVNFDDLLALAKNYNKTSATWAQGDFNGDGVVNFNDLLILAKNYNKSLPAPAPVVSVTTAAAPVTANAVLTDDETKAKPVFSTTPVVKPAPAKPKAVAKPKGR